MPTLALLTLLHLLAAPAEDGTPVLFDGKSLRGWKITNFAGEGVVKVKGGAIQIADGDPMNGITWDGPPLPRLGYELSLEARRVAGGDFFCGLTFPVGPDPISLILGGWGGTVVGLSSLDGNDASENETTTRMSFKPKRWYRVRVRVTPAAVVQVFIDDAKVIDVATAGRKVSIRPEVELSRPLGIATWRTSAELRALRLKRIE